MAQFCVAGLPTLTAGVVIVIAVLIIHFGPSVRVDLKCRLSM
ncbi:hypothetical protein [Streptomyces microflavus]|nr:hypothetical protein [Streptomyces microflavus]